MEKLVFRTLKAEEIECRVGQVGKDSKGFSLLLYKTARVDANVLDETVGCFNWQKRFYQVKNTMICEISINANFNHPESGEPYWVSKADGGDESNTEAIKGECSDAMKRAGFQWGIGRELYYSPFIWIQTTQENQSSGRYSVKEVEFGKNREFTKLTIVNDKTGEIVYSYPKGANKAQNGEKPQNNAVASEKGTIAKEDLSIIELYLSQCDEPKRYSFFTWLEGLCNTMTPANLTYEQGRNVATKLRGKLFNGK